MRKIDEKALEATIKDMASYRPNLPQNTIRQMISDWLTYGVEPLSETYQDVVWAYQKALEAQL